MWYYHLGDHDKGLFICLINKVRNSSENITGGEVFEGSPDFEDGHPDLANLLGGGGGPQVFPKRNL